MKSSWKPSSPRSYGAWAKEALELTAEEIEMARDEVKSAIDHHLDERDYIGIGLDAWEIVRNL
jgi:hypothetical protein